MASAGPGSSAVSGAAPTAPAKDFDAIIAVDFGTHGTGYAISFPTPEALADPSKADVVPCKPGEGVGRGDKQLTALLLNPKDMSIIQFGSKARKTFADMCDNPKAEPALYFHTFKMALAPSPSRPRDVMRIALPAVGKVNAGGGAGTDGGYRPTADLLTLVQRVLEYVKGDAYGMLGERFTTRDVATLKIFWVLTVPAIWDDEGKAFMRAAAHRAGMTASVDAANLMLALEPECAVLASITEISPVERDNLKAGTRVMVVDCGGGTVDITVDEIVTVKPLCLREVAAPSGGPWGATYVDKHFMAFIKEIVGDKWSFVDHSAQLELLSVWEVEKRGIGDSLDCISVPMTDVISNISEHVEGWDKAQLTTQIEDFNSKHGLEGEDAVKLSKARRLQIPARFWKFFFEGVIAKTCEHIEKLLSDSKTGKIDYMVVAGGFAESHLLTQTLRDKFERDGRCRVLLPKRPGQVVNTGAALFALQPQAIKERVMRWTYAYIGAEPFNAAVHDERHAFTTSEGRKLCNILYPLVQQGDAVEISHPVEKKGLIPVRSDQVVIDFDIYRTLEVVVDPRKEPLKPRSVPVDVKTDGGRNVGVLKSDRAATLTVTIGATDRPRNERMVNLSMSFGTTEIVATAEAVHSKEKKVVTIKYDSM